MKKVLAVFLAVLMAFSFVSMTAFAKVENEEKIVDELMNGEYSHVGYVVNKNYFKTEIGAYTLINAYDKAWDNFFTGSVDTDYAKTILLALIDRFEAEYNNETFEEIIKVLKGAKTAADLVEKLDKYTGILDLAENATWANSLTAVSTIIKIMNMSNDLYEKYIEAYAVVLSCQAASIYYADFLDYIAANVDDKNVKTAAKELKANITKNLDEARDDIIADLGASLASDGISIGISAAMSSNTVTAVINTVYNAIGSLGDKLFNTKDKYLYMSSLAMLVKIEDVLPAYVEAALAGEDETAADFAVVALLTMRETGESMLANLGKVTEDSIAAKLVNSNDNLRITTQNAAIAATKLNVYGELLKLEDSVNVYDVYTSIGNSKKATLTAADGTILGIISAGKDYEAYDENAYYVNAYSDAAASYIQVIVTFVPDASVEYATVSTGGTTGGSSSSGKTGIAAIFQSIIDAIVNAFKNLFSFGKKK